MFLSSSYFVSPIRLTNRPLFQFSRPFCSPSLLAMDPHSIIIVVRWNERVCEMERVESLSLDKRENGGVLAGNSRGSFSREWREWEREMRNGRRPSFITFPFCNFPSTYLIYQSCSLSTVQISPRIRHERRLFPLGFRVHFQAIEKVANLSRRWMDLVTNSEKYWWEIRIWESEE